MCGVPDHFTRVASHYALARPSYPPALFEWLALHARQHQLAWDVGAGNGQASLALAAHFDHVLATDLSAKQLQYAPEHERIEYRAAPCEASGLDDACVDLVTVAQALHWFDVDRFHDEVRRVLRPGGLIAEWSYGVFRAEDPSIDKLLQAFYHDGVGDYWPPERRHVENGYSELPFPFQRLRPPPFQMVQRWPLESMLNYLRSWSATGRKQEVTGVDPVEALAPDLAAAWGDPELRRRITWPLALRVGMK